MIARSWLTRLGVVVTLIGMTSAARAQDLPQPTAEHKILAQDAGTWDATIKTYTAGPDAEPSVSKGTEVNTVMAGGFWVLSKFEGKFEGLGFEGRGQFGYDTVKNKYVGTWIDSMGSSLTVLEGSYDAKSKTMTYEGETVEPNSKQKMTQKMVTKLNDDGTRTFTLYMKGAAFGGKEMKIMEVSYTKRK